MVLAALSFVWGWEWAQLPGLTEVGLNFLLFPASPDLCPEDLCPLQDSLFRYEEEMEPHSHAVPCQVS